MVKQLAIYTHGLTKRFDDRIAVREVNLKIPYGEVYGLIGPNGAGKTTLIKLLAMAEEPTQGKIWIYGDRLVPNQPNDRVKGRLGYLPDDFPLYNDMTVWEYLEYFARLYDLPPSRRHKRVREVLELVRLTDKETSLTATLSRGMKQRLSLARTVLHRPVMLLLDEPVSGLDPVARQLFRDIIKTLQKSQITILISSHILSDLAELCTSIGIMEQGNLVYSGPLSELYASAGQQQILVAATGDLNVLKAQLKSSPGVGAIEELPNSSRLRVDFSGTSDQAAELMRSLIKAGIPITEFQCTPGDLESIFLKSGHQKTS
ncbi:MAG: ABC transporter ATP-binding protein [Cyanosarcina radialis HA8281-LM2]|jgi:ABC-2 type transport system ATP-binding protein|nr:ABC transporter ATP-binding protein [Cyanosarcina radialis HA8281-LM2]